MKRKGQVVAFGPAVIIGLTVLGIALFLLSQFMPAVTPILDAGQVANQEDGGSVLNSLLIQILPFVAVITLFFMIFLFVAGFTSEL